ncbi:hypothetical protein QDY72_00175 [Kingella negevensis]|uniref:hypothetical protein n=1 Tax=Kingella negevensis TaxID=1522312 RepID=UPI00254DC2AB|nr:hypothetical protein [Kingella negevensis]MDK4680735.1 hypothetical protein [Kingella negevensis]MDK4681542.1 hypothetical protein [Kingella negevensis]MDK4683624.1 hypothetical protein [Kingella negevensis]MDK4691929.1 hypothetical protein [Kingella negevensis]MDK4692918.1 hypothetical protein [Kingella negevensis]
MINLYQILQLSHNASPATIQAVLNNAQNANAIKAVQEWLLVPDVRQRYNVKLKSEYPEFFQAATPINKPKIAPLSEETADDGEYMDLPPLWNPNAAANWIWAGVYAVIYVFSFVTGKFGISFFVLLGWYFFSARKQTQFSKPKRQPET